MIARRVALCAARAHAVAAASAARALSRAGAMSPAAVGATAVRATVARGFSTSSTKETEKSFEEIIAGIDTTLTTEQQLYVNSLKKKMKGARGQRSLYRDVPRSSEVEATGNFLPKQAETAEQLIDWALSHIPKRDGPRRSREKKRMKIRHDIRRADAARRKKEVAAARVRKEAKLVRIREEVKAIKQQGETLRQLQVLKAQAREARAAAGGKV